MITLTKTTTAKRRINRAQSGKEYIMEGFLEPGLVSYDDVGAGVARLNKEAIDKMLPSFVGCPITIDHVEESKDEVLNGKAGEDGKPLKRGEVTRAWWNAETGKFDCAFTVEDKEADELVKNGVSGSCAYNVTETGPGGELHAMPYDEEITNGAFEHLALVTNPRYEDCKIRVNSKPAKINASEQVPVRIMMVSRGTWAVVAKGENLKTAPNKEELKRWIKEENAKPEHVLKYVVASEENDDFMNKKDNASDQGLKDLKEKYEARGYYLDKIGQDLVLSKKGHSLERIRMGRVAADNVDQNIREYEDFIKENSKENAMDNLRTTYKGETIEVRKEGEGWVGTCKKLGLKTGSEKTAGEATNVLMAMVDDGARNNSKTCPSCNGYTTDPQGYKCETCHGKGTVKDKENAKMECVECGATFSHKNPTVETRCPKCHGYDVEVANAKPGQKCAGCGQPGLVLDKDGLCPECDYPLSPAEQEAMSDASWNKKNAQDRQAMFDKEKADHPEFTDEQIWKIVEDHEAIGENKKNGLPTCKKCAGSGVKDKEGHPCATCGGTGAVQKENAGLDQPFGSTLSFESNHTTYKGHQIEQVGDNKWKVWKGSRFLANLPSEQEAKSFIDQKQNAKLMLSLHGQAVGGEYDSMQDILTKKGFKSEKELKDAGFDIFEKTWGKENSEYADVKVGQKVRALGGVEFKSEMTVSRISGGDLWLKASDGKEIGPFDLPLAPYKKNGVTSKDIGKTIQFRGKKNPEVIFTGIVRDFSSNGWATVELRDGTRESVAPERMVNAKQNAQKGDMVHIDTSAAGVPKGTAGVIVRVSGNEVTVRTTKGDIRVLEGDVIVIPENDHFNGKDEDESFMKSQEDLKKGEVVRWKGSDWRVVQKDNYPIGTPGYWVKKEQFNSKTITLKNGAFDADGVYAKYIDHAKSGGRDPREMLKTRFGLTKSEIEHVMSQYEKKNSGQIVLKNAFKDSFSRDGKRYYKTGKTGTRRSTGKKSAEYRFYGEDGKQDDRLWADEDGDIYED